MNKDAILASVIGFGIGLLITGAILLGPNMIASLQRPTSSGEVASAQNQNTATQPSPTIAVTSDSLQIDSPTPEQIVTSATLAVSGKSSANTMVMVAGPMDETVTQIDTSGTFSQTVTLKEGKNDISVTLITPDKQEIKQITVYYTPE